MSGIIPKEKSSTFQRWHIGAFDQPRPEPTALPQAQQEPETPEPEIVSIPQVSLPSAEDVERIFEEARTSGYQEGYDAGLAAGQEAGAAAVDAEIHRFSQLATNLQQAIGHLEQDVADQLLSLATEIASQMLRGTLSVKQDVLVPIIREAISALPIHHTHLTVRLNPEDASRIRAQMGDQLAQTGTQIVEDPEIAVGGCLVRAGASEVDATTATRWRRVLEAIGAEPQEWLNP
jgi:flagellar assembly protein FliH